VPMRPLAPGDEDVHAPEGMPVPAPSGNRAAGRFRHVPWRDPPLISLRRDQPRERRQHSTPVSSRRRFQPPAPPHATGRRAGVRVPRAFGVAGVRWPRPSSRPPWRCRRRRRTASGRGAKIIGAGVAALAIIGGRAVFRDHQDLGQLEQGRRGQPDRGRQGLRQGAERRGRPRRRRPAAARRAGGRSASRCSTSSTTSSGSRCSATRADPSKVPGPSTSTSPTSNVSRRPAGRQGHRLHPPDRYRRVDHRRQSSCRSAISSWQEVLNGKQLDTTSPASGQDLDWKITNRREERPLVREPCSTPSPSRPASRSAPSTGRAGRAARARRRRPARGGGRPDGQGVDQARPDHDHRRPQPQRGRGAPALRADLSWTAPTTGSPTSARDHRPDRHEVRRHRLRQPP